MIISTIVGNPFSILFLICNYLTFCILTSIMPQGISQFGPLDILLTILISLIASTLYSLTDQKLLNMAEEDIINTSKYDTKIKCNVFKNYNARYIFKLTEDTCYLYTQSMNAKLIYYRDGPSEFISKLKKRVLNLNILDRFCIYLYKYISGILLSIAFISLLQISKNFDIIRIGFINVYLAFDNKFIELLILILIWYLLIILFFYINEIFVKLITKIIKKRGLEFFIHE